MAIASLDLAYQSMAKMNLWFKNRVGESFSLADVPQIIPLRWTYFKNNWDFLRASIIDQIPSYSNPDLLQLQIDQLSEYIEIQRLLPNSGNPFGDPKIANRFYTVFDSILIDSIDLSNDEQIIISSQQTAIQNLSRNDFVAMKNSITAYRDSYAAEIGLSDPTYDEVFSLAATTPLTSANSTNVRYLLTLQDSIKTIDFILANLFAVDAKFDAFALARQNANNPLINIGQYQSGRLVKLNYQEDLSALAYRYFGDPNRWIDIALANGLKPPYIDEIGEKLPLIVNGRDNTISIGAVSPGNEPNNNKVYVNQIVYIQSNTRTFLDQRIIKNIREIPVNGEIVLELDGEENLDLYKTVDSAYIRVFKPNTTNSGFFILIPSDEVLADARQDSTPWFLTNSAQDEKLAKVDLALDADGDINFSPNGDLLLSYGVANAIQAVQLKMQTELGSLRLHPNYGLVNVVGIRTGDIEQVKTLLTDSINEQIAADSRFDRVESLFVDYLVNTNNPNSAAAFSISMSVRMAGGSTVVPITFTLKV